MTTATEIIATFDPKYLKWALDSCLVSVAEEDPFMSTQLLSHILIELWHNNLKTIGSDRYTFSIAEVNRGVECSTFDMLLTKNAARGLSDFLTGWDGDTEIALQEVEPSHLRFSASGWCYDVKKQSYPYPYEKVLKPLDLSGERATKLTFDETSFDDACPEEDTLLFDWDGRRLKVNSVEWNTGKKINLDVLTGDETEGNIYLIKGEGKKIKFAMRAEYFYRIKNILPADSFTIEATKFSDPVVIRDSGDGRKALHLIMPMNIQAMGEKPYQE